MPDAVLDLLQLTRRQVHVDATCGGMVGHVVALSDAGSRDPIAFVKSPNLPRTSHVLYDDLRRRWLNEVAFYTTSPEHIRPRLLGMISEEMNGASFLIVEATRAIGGDPTSMTGVRQLITDLSRICLNGGAGGESLGVPQLRSILGSQHGLVRSIFAANRAAISELLTSTQVRHLVRFVDAYDDWVELVPIGRNLVHGDFRLDNLGTVVRDGTVRVVAFDWQTAAAGVSWFDAAHLACNVGRPDSAARLAGGLGAREVSGMTATGLAVASGYGLADLILALALPAAGRQLSALAIHIRTHLDSAIRCGLLDLLA